MFLMKMPADGSVGTSRIHSLSDFIESQINIFTTCHYRVLVHILIQFFLLLPEWIFDFVNTAALLFAVKLTIPREIDRRHFPIVFLAVLCFVWLLHPDLGNAYFWTTGAINYTWTIIPLLLYVRTLVKVLESDYCSSALIYLAPFVASANENALISLFGVTCLLGLYKWRKAGKLPKKILVACGILLLGGLIMVLSPSATARLAREGFHYESLSWRLLEFVKRAGFYTISYSSVILLFFLFNGRKILWRNGVVLMLFGTIVLSLMSMIAVPIFEPRSSVFGFFVSVYLALYLLKSSRGVNLWFAALLLGLSILFGYQRLQVFQDVNKKLSVNYAILEKSKGKSLVTLDKQCKQSEDHYIVCYEIDERDSYINQSIEHYYGVDKIKLNDDFSRKHQRDKWASLLSQDATSINASLSEFRKLADNVFIKNDKMGTHILIDLGVENFSVDKTTILRGSRKGFLKHKLLNVLPTHYRLYFLDFLEYTGTYYKDGKSVLITAENGKTYAYHLVYELERYDKFYYSSYSLKNHAPIGEVHRIELVN